VHEVTRTFYAEENEERFELPQGDGYATVIDTGHEVWIAEVWVRPGSRRGGLGGLLLKTVVARHAGRVIALSAEPFDTSRHPQRPGPGAAQLAAWYERHGFRRDGGHRMVRPPPRHAAADEKEEGERPVRGVKP
jgi:GNAT superfamily N-acetyltransferase